VTAFILEYSIFFSLEYTVCACKVMHAPYISNVRAVDVQEFAISHSELKVCVSRSLWFVFLGEDFKERTSGATLKVALRPRADDLVELAA